MGKTYHNLLNKPPIQNSIIIPQKWCFFKINRAKGVTDEEGKDYVYIPINKDLENLLMEMGYNEFRDTDRYILAPFEKKKRKTVMDLMSKSFSHFYDQLNTGKRLQFKHLRKTYISNLFLRYGENARLISKHADFEVIKNHYLDQKLLTDVNKDFSVFE